MIFAPEIHTGFVRIMVVVASKRHAFIPNQFFFIDESDIFERMETRLKVADTDEGKELQARVEELRDLLDAYRSGAVTENHDE